MCLSPTTSRDWTLPAPRPSPEEDREPRRGDGVVTRVCCLSPRRWWARSQHHGLGPYSRMTDETSDGSQGCSLGRLPSTLTWP